MIKRSLDVEHTALQRRGSLSQDSTPRDNLYTKSELASFTCAKDTMDPKLFFLNVLYELFFIHSLAPDIANQCTNFTHSKYMKKGCPDGYGHSRSSTSDKSAQYFIFILYSNYGFPAQLTMPESKGQCAMHKPIS